MTNKPAHHIPLIIMVIKTIFLSFAVPPNIEDSLSSSDIIVREGVNITLKCKATGSPAPTVKWKRDDNSKIAINKSLIGECATETHFGTFNTHVGQRQNGTGGVRDEEEQQRNCRVSCN